MLPSTLHPIGVAATYINFHTNTIPSRNDSFKWVIIFSSYNLDSVNIFGTSFPLWSCKSYSLLADMSWKMVDNELQPGSKSPKKLTSEEKGCKLRHNVWIPARSRQFIIYHFAIFLWQIHHNAFLYMQYVETIFIGIMCSNNKIKRTWTLEKSFASLYQYVL